MKIVEENKVVKTQDFEQNVVTYLTKTAKHLFITEKGEFFKVLPFENNNETYALVMEFNGETSWGKVLSVKQYVRWYDVNAKSCLKQEIFGNTKVKSIKNFKAMKELMSEMIEHLKIYDMTNINVSNDIRDNIGIILKGMKPKV